MPSRTAILGTHKLSAMTSMVRELGLEWLYRWIQEPRRLWGRYTKTIPPFIWLAFKQLLTSTSFISTPFHIRERYLGWKN